MLIVDIVRSTGMEDWSVKEWYISEKLTIQYLHSQTDRKRQGKTGQYGSDLREGPVDGYFRDVWLIITKSCRFAFK